MSRPRRRRAPGALALCAAAGLLHLPTDQAARPAEWYALHDRPDISMPTPARGTLTPAGPPLAPTRVSAGGNCVIDLRQRYTLSGTLVGTAEIDYRILTYGPCPQGPPAPGTYDETWIARGTFAGTVAGVEGSADFTYSATVQRGGLMEGRIQLGGRLRGALVVTGSMAAEALSYAGEVELTP